MDYLVCMQVEELVRLSLNHPVRLFVDSNMDVADNLRQEFIRIKAKKEGDREAIVTGEHYCTSLTIATRCMQATVIEFSDLMCRSFRCSNSVMHELDI